MARLTRRPPPLLPVDERTMQTARTREPGAIPAAIRRKEKRKEKNRGALFGRTHSSLVTNVPIVVALAARGHAGGASDAIRPKQRRVLVRQPLAPLPSRA
ncbi:hypothetical protein MRX96_012150 [Rhipicephalus microplus]